jgi:ankyrin repeat protein
MMAAYWGHAKVVEALLAGGANVEEKDNHGYVAADFAGSEKHQDIVELLNRAKPKSP